MSPARNKKQTSSGGIIFFHQGAQWHIALIRRRTQDSHTVWCLPKGWVEPGETLEETALREVREETGLDGKILEKLGDISYRFYDQHSKSRIHKTVHFFLLKYLTGDTSQHDHEVEEARWFKAEHTNGMLTYPSEKEILKKALKILKDRY